MFIKYLFLSSPHISRNSCASNYTCVTFSRDQLLQSLWAFPPTSSPHLEQGQANLCSHRGKLEPVCVICDTMASTSPLGESHPRQPQHKCTDRCTRRSRTSRKTSLTPPVAAVFLAALTTGFSMLPRTQAQCRPWPAGCVPPVWSHTGAPAGWTYKGVQRT